MYLVGRVGSECVCEGYVRGKKRVLEGSGIFRIIHLKASPVQMSITKPLDRS